MKKNHILSASFSALAAFAVMSAAAQTVTNPGFEDNSLGGNGYGAISGWTNNTGISGVNNATQPFLEQTAHSGTQVAFLQNSSPGGSQTISQSLTGFDPTKQYSVTYFVSERGLSATTASSTSVSLNGGTTTFSNPGNIVKTDAFRRVVSGPFTPTGVNSTLQLNALGVSGDSSLLIDSVTVGRAVPVVTNGGFETPVQPTTSTTTRFKQGSGAGGGSLAGSTWTFADGGGITRNLSAFAPAAAPEGSQAGILQNTSQFSTTVSGFEAGVSYSLSFVAAGRTGGANPFQVLLNGSPLTFGASTTITPTVGSYGSFTSTSFTTTGGAFSLAFIGTNPGGDRTSFIDDIRFNFVAEGGAPAGELKITSITKSGSTVTVQFEGINGKTYDLNKSTTLDFTTPDIKDTATLSGTTGTLEDTTATEEKAFYRVEQQP